MKEVNDMSRKEHICRMKMDLISLYVDILRAITDAIIWINLKLVKHTTKMIQKRSTYVRRLGEGDYERTI